MAYYLKRIWFEPLILMWEIKQVCHNQWTEFTIPHGTIVRLC